MHLPQSRATVMDSFYTTTEKVGEKKKRRENQKSLKGQKSTFSREEVK